MDGNILMCLSGVEIKTTTKTKHSEHLTKWADMRNEIKLKG